jgi:hypothetical protein
MARATFSDYSFMIHDCNMAIIIRSFQFVQLFTCPPKFRTAGRIFTSQCYFFQSFSSFFFAVLNLQTISIRPTSHACAVSLVFTT